MEIEMVIEKKINIAVFASGNGTNAREILTNSLPLAGGLHTEQGTMEKYYTVGLIVCNKPGAGVLQIAKEFQIPSLLIERDRFYTGDAYLNRLHDHHIDLIVLAGFLWKVPETLIHAFPKKIINIHPALLPKYGGKNMYGQFVHEAVLAAGEKESGITIHYVDELYDHGEIIFSKTCPVDVDETPGSLAAKVHALEHRFYPTVINDLCKKQMLS
jgi:phosphoribosylglycinamide formyltransferase-1